MTHRLELESPRADLCISYRGLVSEFAERGDSLVPFVLSMPNEDFAVFLEKLLAWSRGEGLPEGFVPHSTFFLVRDGSEVVGVSNFRHRLTEALRIEGGHIGYGIRPSARGIGYGSLILRETLARARKAGLFEVWLTCAKTNTASARTILRNGGELMSEEYIERRGEIVQRYRIPLNGKVDAL